MATHTKLIKRIKPQSILIYNLINWLMDGLITWEEAERLFYNWITSGPLDKGEYN